MFERGSLTLFRVRGVPVRAHWTLLLLVVYLAVAFASQLPAVARLAGVAPGELLAPPLAWGVLLAVGLFASVALHELGHTLIALRVGGRVRDVTLMMLGGVSHFERMPSRPGAEAVVAAAGPATSLALGAVLLAVAHAFAPGPADLRLGTYYLGTLNVSLGVFNLVPAFPMDGGRLLRAALASRLGHLRATDVAAHVGRALAVVFAVAGVLVGNWLLVLIAVFVWSGARLERDGERLRAVLAGTRVADLLVAAAPTIDLDAPVADALPLAHAAGRLELLVVDDARRPVGVLRVTDLAALEPSRRASLTVRQLDDTLRRAAVSVAWTASAADALEAAAAAGADYVVVVFPTGEGAAAPFGLLGRREIADRVALRAVEVSPPPRGAHPGAPPAPA